MRADTLERLLAATEGRRPVVLATRLSDGAQQLLFDGEGAGSDEWPIEDARRALREDRTLIAGYDAGDILLRPYNPPVRLFVVGAVHVGQPLAAIASAAGLDVTVIDPRDAFATTDRFPGVTLVNAWPAPALGDAKLDHRSAVVALAHDPKIDEPALIAALATPAFYVGALGSRTTHEKRLRSLREAGASEEDLARIQAPIGLDIDARAPGEIAIAIVAELIAHLRRPADG